ncbi:MAG: holo-ACP synthase [Epsilonproteobacteria bacterium]|nr:holo-ACP synthase [Campylobacterota bacterium]
MIGIDIVEIKRISNLKNKFGDKALKRFLTPQEIKHISKDETLAGYYAAKEAFSKAIGSGIGKECSFLDIEIKKTDKNKPYFSENTLKKFNLQAADLSISHDGGFAIAAVIVIKSHF